MVASRSAVGDFTLEGRGGAGGADGSGERDGRAVGPARSLRLRSPRRRIAAGAPSEARGSWRAGGGGVRPPRLPLEPKRLDRARSGNPGRTSGPAARDASG